jgi:hypothetical protein
MTELPILNQVYRITHTLGNHHKVAENFEKFNKYSLKSNFLKFNNNNPQIKGRRYDASIILTQIDFMNKSVCELGARDSILGPYLTGFANNVYVSDYFEMWEKGTINDLGQPDYWFSLWKKAAINSDKLTCEIQNITKLSYENEQFDVVIALSVIDFTYNQHQINGSDNGDIMALNEMVRICKPDGIIAISLSIGNISTDISGVHVYSENELFERLINPSGCKIYGKYDFNLKNKLNDSLFNINEFYPVSNVIFFLQK